DAGELHAVLADDAAHLGDVEDALREWKSFWPQARPAERLYVRDRAVALTAKLPPAEAQSMLARYGIEEPKRVRELASRSVGRVMGCVLPLSGKGHALGERALRGALLAAELVDPAFSSAPPVELRIRDSASDPARAAHAVDELADEGVAAVLGSPERA